MNYTGVATCIDVSVYVESVPLQHDLRWDGASEPRAMLMYPLLQVRHQIRAENSLDLKLAFSVHVHPRL